MLMLDRYLVAGGRAMDLATGSTIRWQVRRGRSRTPDLFTMRGRSWLIDFDVRGTSQVEVWERRPACGTDDAAADTTVVGDFRSALADARDGRPHALDLTEASVPRWSRIHRLLARESRVAGFVPLAADAFGAVLAQAHWRWPLWLRDRALVIFAVESRLSPDASLALFRLATKDARPHVIVRHVGGESWRPRLVSAALHVHEAASGDLAISTDALTSRAEALHQDGKFVDAEAAARWSLLLSTDDDAAARCALARSLLAQRRPLEAKGALDSITGGDADALRAAIAVGASSPRFDASLASTCVEILRACQEADDSTTALSRVADLLRRTLACTTVGFVMRDRDRAHVIAHAGACPPAGSRLPAALRALDTAVPEPPACRTQTDEAAWPIRYGGTVVAAVWCRWSTGVPLLPEDVQHVVGLAATAVAPAAYQATEQLRSPATSTLVPDLVGESSAMQEVRQAVMRAAASPFPVLIEGESGAGKELVARAIHAASVRRTRKWCALNCAAIADDLVEAELFGHTRGAFTGAVAERAGLFEDAQGGTLFLDEVAELSARVQAKLLRTVQENEVRRLGESTTRRVDARLVAATNRPLAAEVTAGRFRADLRYRLDVLRITIPPLRERVEDVPILARHLWSELARGTGSRAVLSPSMLQALGRYDWPGNVRELQNVLASAMVAAPPRGVVGPLALPAHVTRTHAVSSRSTLADARREFEQRFVQAALARSGGRAMVAARELGVSRQGFVKLAARLGLAQKA